MLRKSSSININNYLLCQFAIARVGVSLRVGLFVASPRKVPLSLHFAVGFPLLSLTQLVMATINVQIYAKLDSFKVYYFAMKSNVKDKDSADFYTSLCNSVSSLRTSV